MPGRAALRSGGACGRLRACRCGREPVGQQRRDMAHQRVRIDRLGAGQPAPDVRGGQRQQRQPDQRRHHQRRLQARVELPAANRCRQRRHQRAGAFQRKAPEHALAQCAVVAGHFADPQAREPRRLRDGVDQSGRDADQHRQRLVVGRAAGKEAGHQRLHFFLDHGVEQQVAVAEVVVHQCRGDAGRCRDGLDRRPGHALPREQLGGRVEDALALSGLARRRSARAAPGWLRGGGFAGHGGWLGGTGCVQFILIFALINSRAVTTWACVMEAEGAMCFQGIRREASKQRCRPKYRRPVPSPACGRGLGRGPARRSLRPLIARQAPALSPGPQAGEGSKPAGMGDAVRELPGALPTAAHSSCYPATPY
ncbi:protein of unknown function [Cupriavidus taiwanensis]|uniref:Uncharacterized protein n=1 Tax=Cupriavidus taiwanensis TaxID=164546 RepID=A0A7Z7NKX5_9BURK|nr:protein of unknown function [Cupriavidus taiwanensis]SOZ01283.1 hypothetical protein CBM2595_A30154 [Cupriavidus taiwanensis]SOZ04194.1 hypothetical protein CBM2597_A50307 [Cupriavidus taiwanensis]SPC08836.1 hypothetical protein CBM2594_A40159 [Cupriavidus taiwanensis]SPD38627.1 protein of unknown function [Cupriavidus taiwanensis]